MMQISKLGQSRGPRRSFLDQVQNMSSSDLASKPIRLTDHLLDVETDHLTEGLTGMLGFGCCGTKEVEKGCKSGVFCTNRSIAFRLAT